MIRDIFLLQNPWRTQTDFPFKLKNRNILPLLINALSSPKNILGLIGSRQVGKSSLMFLLIQHLLQHGTNSQNIFYFNLDDLKLHELFDNMPDFIDFTGAKNGGIFIFIDEVQRLENPGLFLKALYDLGLNIKIIYSGSSQLEIKSKLREHLVGRGRQFEIQRLCFEEFTAAQRIGIDNIQRLHIVLLVRILGTGQLYSQPMRLNSTVLAQLDSLGLMLDTLVLQPTIDKDAVGIEIALVYFNT